MSRSDNGSGCKSEAESGHSMSSPFASHCTIKPSVPVKVVAPSKRAIKRPQETQKEKGRKKLKNAEEDVSINRKFYKITYHILRLHVKGTDGKTKLLNFVVQEIIRSEGLRAARRFQEIQSTTGVQTEVLVEDLAQELADITVTLAFRWFQV
ncbi:hypothetical protein MTR67_032466 [Solanum verrucosum]|uniref:Uncharacterized protein n=1 Tax=Solanum verrucosum TaxID=315347 RepID=A0AAF0U4J3_SOLVR|nr:hypothetical protein MTR67_032466 [Solanum verrucosum]